MPTFVVDVTLTDRTRLPNGRYREFTARAEIEAETETEARLLAVQLTTAVRADRDVMPLGDRVVSVAI